MPDTLTFDSFMASKPTVLSRDQAPPEGEQTFDSFMQERQRLPVPSLNGPVQPQLLPPGDADRVATHNARILVGAQAMLNAAVAPPVAPAPVPGIPGGMAPPAHTQMADVQPVNRWQPLIGGAEQAVTGHAVQSLGGATATQLYDNAVNSLSDMVTRTIRPEHLPPGTKTMGPFVNQLLRGIPELGDWLMSPIGAATATGLTTAPMAVRAGAAAFFQTQMSQQAKDDIVTAYKNPTPENLGRATKSLAMAVLPMLHPAAEAKRAAGEKIAEARTQPRIQTLGLQEKPYAPQTAPAGPQGRTAEPAAAAPQPKPAAGLEPGQRPAALTVAAPGPPGTAAQEAKPAAAPAEIAGFTTAKGSTYEIAGKGTRRSKVATGEQFEPSHRTVYVTPEVNRRVMETLQAENVGTTKASIRSVGDGQVGIVVKDRATGAMRNDRSKVIPFTEQPAVGLHPIEIWDKDPKTGEYGFHVGNAITEIRPAAPEVPQARPTVPPGSPGEPGPIEQRATIEQERLNERRRETREPVESGAVGERPAVYGTRAPGTRPVSGENTEILIPGEDRSLKARYEVRELAELAPSHSGHTFNPNEKYAYHNERDYSKPENQERLIENSSEEKFNPRYHITDNPDATNGPPVIDQPGNVIGGNSRSMILQRVYGRGQAGADAYRNLLQRNASHFGIDPEAVKGMKHPVLVRVVPDEEWASVPGGAKWGIRKTNVTGTAQLSAAERAVADAGQLSPDLLEHIGAAIEKAGPDATLNEALEGKSGTALANRLIAEGFFSEQERPSLMDGKTGVLTQLAKDRIAKALTGRFFRDSDQFQRTPASIKQKLERISAPLAKTQGEGEWDLTPAFRQAVDLVEYANAHGIKNLNDVLAQENLFGQGPEWSPEAVTLAKWLRDRKPNDLVSAVRKFVNDRGPTMFGEPDPRESFALHFEETPRPLVTTSIVPRMSGRSLSYARGQDTRVHAALGRIEAFRLDPEEARYAHAYVVNPYAMELANRVLNQQATPDVAAERYAATQIDPASLWTAARMMETAHANYGQKEATRELRQAMERAAQDGKSLVLVNDHPRISQETRQMAFREEIHHAMQAKLSGGDLGTHIWRSQVRFFQEATARRAASALARRGYRNISDGQMAAEIGVRLMDPGRFGEMDLEYEQARALAALYVRTLRSDYGHAEPRTVAREVFRTFRRESEPGRGQPGPVPGSPGPGRGGGPAGGTRPNISASIGGGTPLDSQSGGPGQRGQLRGPGLLGAEAGPGQRVPQVETPPAAPRESSASSVTFGTGLGGLEPLFRESKAEGDALRAKRNAAMAAIKAAEATPEQKDAGEALRSYFTSERDLWAAKANQALDIIQRKVLPKIQDREAVTIMREFRDKPQELAAFIDGSHPWLQEADGGAGIAMNRLKPLLPQMREALRMIANPNTRERTVDTVLTNMAGISLREGQKGGWLESRWEPPVYVPHLFNPKGEGELAKLPAVVRRRQGKIGKFFAFSQRRQEQYPTMLHGIADGLIPKTLDPVPAFMIHQDNFARARATHLLEAQLAEHGMGKWSGDGRNVPDDWVRLAPHSDEWVKRFAFEAAAPAGQQPGTAAAAEAVAQRKLAAMKAGQSYEQISKEIANELSGQADLRVGEMGLYVPEFVAKALDPITAPEMRSPAFARIRTAQRGLKEAILGLSGFHLLTENFMAAADIGPKGMVEAFKARRGTRDFLENERDFIRSGGTTSIQGATMGAYRSLQPGTIPTRGEVIRAYIPGAKMTLKLADDITRLTFDNVQRKFKVISFQLHRDAWLRDNPHATPEQTERAKQGIASYINGVYGGLHWENMGVSRMATDIARFFLLAPDWSFSNVALAKYAAERTASARELLPGKGRLAGAMTKESAQARLSRAFWTKQIVGGLVATQFASLMFSGKLSPRPFQAYLGDDKDGRSVYQNLFFRGSAGDLVNLANKMVEHGLLIGIGNFIQGKEAPFIKAGSHVLTGKDDLGREIAPKDLNALANTVRSVGTAIGDISPIPITGRNIYRMFAGDGSDQYLWSEKVLSEFGPPAQHAVPEGYRMTEQGLVPKEEPEGEENSVWQQIMTGKARAVGGRR